MDVAARIDCLFGSRASESHGDRGVIQDGSQTTWMAVGKGRPDQGTQCCMPVQPADWASRPEA